MASRLLSNFLTVGGATLLSRVLGFVRDTMIAAELGTGPVADAFFVAFRLPNLFRRLFAEGAFNSAFVPLYARTLEGEGEEAARTFARDTFGMLVLSLATVSAVAMIGAPWLVGLLAPGFGDEPAKFDLTVFLTRICFPYLACMSLTGLFGGILNSHGRFKAAAFAPVLLNVVLIAVLVGIAASGQARTSQAGVILSWGVAAAGLAQLLLVIVAVMRGGWGFVPGRPRWTKALGRLLSLGLPGLIGGGVTQINIAIGTIIASLQAGAVSYLYYADRVYQLPLGIVGIAIGVVLLPEVARRVREGRPDLAFEAQNRSLEFAAVLTLPAAVALVVAAHPIVEVLFERGAFGAMDTTQTARALAAFGLGLPAFVLVKVLSPAFFAREDTRTPMAIGIVVMIANVVASLALFPSLGHVAIAVATSASGWLNAGLLQLVLARRGHWRVDGELEARLPRILLAALSMGVVVAFAGSWLGPWLGAENPLAVKISALAALVGGGAALFFGLAHAMGGVDLAAILRLARRRRSDG